MKARTLLIFIAGMVIGGLLLFGVIYFIEGNKTCYVSMSSVFEEAEISQKYREELKQLEAESNQQLASMENEIRELKKKGTAVEITEPMEEELLTMRDRLSDEYQRKTELFDKAAWDHINRKVSEFGKEKGYDYIFGAKGDGSIMYAADAKDLSEELIIYINK